MILGWLVMKLFKWALSGTNKKALV